MADEDTAPPAERLKIADYFITNAPAGEVDEVVKDVKVLVNKNGEVLTTELLTGILAKYNVNCMESAFNPETKDPVVVCAAGKVSENTFVDPSTGTVLEFDHITRKFTATDQKQTLPEAVEGYRAAIARAVRDYVSSNFTDGKCVSSTFGSEDGHVTVCLTGKNVHLGNFYSGSWRAVYKLDVSEEGKKAVECFVRIGSHYFEDGNVQLHSDKKGSFPATVGDAKATAAAVVKIISEFEQSYQNSLEEMYSTSLYRDYSTFLAFMQIFSL